MGGKSLKSVNSFSNLNASVFSEANKGFQQMVTVPSSAIGTLRRELIDTLGIERAKGFLLRYGWNCGVNDSTKMKEEKWENEIDLILAGPKMHTLNGHATVEPQVCEYDLNKGTLFFEGDWKNSYEAKEHIKLFGKSNNPICHSLVGYASGYLSTIMGKTVIVKETKCEAMGDKNCHWIAKTIDLWGNDPFILDEKKYYEADKIGAELEETYEKLRIERDNLSKAYLIHQKLFKQVLYETGLQSIANVFYQTLKIPVFIHDRYFHTTAVVGLSPSVAKKYMDDFNGWINEQQQKNDNREGISKTSLIYISPEQKRLITPIYFQQKIHGYCSFLYEEPTIKEVDRMVLEQVALACSLHLLNERTRFKTEQSLRGNFLEDILSKRISMEELSKRAHYIDFNLKGPYFIVSINRKFEERSIKEEIEFNDQFTNDLLHFFKIKSVNGILGQKSGHVIILLTEMDNAKKMIDKETLCRQLLDFCSSEYPQYFFTIGVSSSSLSINDAFSLFEESTAALKVTNSHQNIIFFDSLGIVGMLLQTKNMETIEKFAYKILGKLIEEDQNKNMELTKTLYHYLENGSNVHKTARAMNFSISGLRYRLERINDILQFDINKVYSRHEMYLALQSLIVLRKLEID